MAISDFIFRKTEEKSKKFCQNAAVMTFDYNRDPQDLTFYHCFTLVALVALGTILSWFDQFQFFFYVKIWTKTKSYVCFIMCDMLLKDMHIGIFNLLVLQQILLRSLDVSSLKNILLNSVFFEKLRRFDSSPFEANQTLVKCHIFKYCVSATKTHSKKERNCLICLKPLLLLLFCPFFYHFDICIIYFWPTLFQQIFNAYMG